MRDYFLTLFGDLNPPAHYEYIGSTVIERNIDEVVRSYSYIIENSNRDEIINSIFLVNNRTRNVWFTYNLYEFSNGIVASIEYECVEKPFGSMEHFVNWKREGF